MTLVKVRMNTAAMLQIHDAHGKPAGFSAVNKGDEPELSPSDAKGFIQAGYASPIEAKATK